MVVAKQLFANDQHEQTAKERHAYAHAAGVKMAVTVVANRKSSACAFHRLARQQVDEDVTALKVGQEHHPSHAEGCAQDLNILAQKVTTQDHGMESQETAE